MRRTGRHSAEHIAPASVTVKPIHRLRRLHRLKLRSTSQVSCSNFLFVICVIGVICGYTMKRELGFRRTLLVADRGLVASGHVDEALAPLRAVGIEVVGFHDFEVNPDTEMVAVGRAFAIKAGIDSIIGLGGGSSMDCAKGINFLVTNGGSIQDYLGYGKATKDFLPMIGIPTTAGTGSEGQSYALISDARTHVKMACGDPKAAFRVALLDPALTVSQPASITATAGLDAIAHAVETYVTVTRNPFSVVFSREAWR